MTQQALAALAELSQSSLSRFEKGQSLPDLYETRQLTRALEISPSQFVDLVDKAFARTIALQKKMPRNEAPDGLATVALAGLAILGVVAILGESAAKKGRR
jgi:transcriptional regulator with XRE-family HTH domain